MTKSHTNRLLSIDALRGFDMFFIAGGAAVFLAMQGITGLPWVDAILSQFRHVPWHGFVFWDLIMPLFLFITGVSMSFSLNKGIELGLSKAVLYKKVAIRMLILIGLGIVIKNTATPIFDPSQIRFVSVLGRIGFASFIGALLYLNYSARGQVYWILGILLSYYAILFLVPVPGYGAGDLSFEGNIVGWIDRVLLPGRLLNGTYDELGLLTQFPALCITVFGCLAGKILQESKKGNEKALTLLALGAGIAAIGVVWGLHFPINKKLWTSSFIMLTSGLCFMLMAVFYWLIDVKGYQKWAFFFKVIGLNSLTVYFLYHFIKFGPISHKLFGGIYAPLPEQWYSVFQALGAWGIIWYLLYVLYKKRLFVKI